MMKDRPINIKKLEKICSSHITTTKIKKINNKYHIIVFKNENQINYKWKIIEEKDISYKKILDEIMILKKNVKKSTALYKIKIKGKNENQ